MSRKPPHSWEFTSTRPVIGTDEVGVGPIAGPICACALTLKPEAHPIWFAGARDSKKLTHAQRESLIDPILKGTLAWRVGWIYPAELEGVDPHQAARDLMAMLVKSLLELSVFPIAPLIVIDGIYTLPLGKDVEQVALTKGDDRCLEVACASIIAKVSRDRYMVSLSRELPDYGFEIHKGYATHAHVQAIEKHGLTSHHRHSPAKKAIETYRAKR